MKLSATTTQDEKSLSLANDDPTHKLGCMLKWESKGNLTLTAAEWYIPMDKLCKCSKSLNIRKTALKWFSS